MRVCILARALLSYMLYVKAEDLLLCDINLIGSVCNYCRPVMIYRSAPGYEMLGEVIIRLSFWLQLLILMGSLWSEAPLHTQCSSRRRGGSLQFAIIPLTSNHTEAVFDDDYTKGNEKNVIKVARLISPKICSAVLVSLNVFSL
jgi:hypothetical protein